MKWKMNFIELEQIFVHITDLDFDWTNRLIYVSKIVQI